jgi:hypothetical protein
MNEMTVADLPVPTTGVEHCLLSILQAWLTQIPQFYQGQKLTDIPALNRLSSAYDLLRIMECALTGQRLLVRRGGGTFDGLCKSKDVYALLAPYIRLSSDGMVELSKAHSALQKGPAE